MPTNYFKKKRKFQFCEIEQTSGLGLRIRGFDYIKEIEEYIKKLEKRGYAYQSDASYYFSISKFKEYGKLSGINVDPSKTKSRLTNDEYSKEEVQDFALWKAWEENDGDVYWNNILGKGRPGWHIECSVMSTKILGKQIDIHAGGTDLIFPHHENEIAQSEAISSKQFVKYWIHSEHLIVEGKKMSKSEGNYFTLRNLLEKGYDQRAIRFLLISSHYRSQLNFTLDGINQAMENVNKLQEIYSKIQGTSANTQEKDTKLSDKTKEALESFVEAMDDDINIPIALASIFNLVKFLNKYLEEFSLSEENKLEILSYFHQINKILEVISEDQLDEKLSNDIISLVNERKNTRINKDWKRSDEIRKELSKKGYTIEDIKNGIILKEKDRILKILKWEE